MEIFELGSSLSINASSSDGDSPAIASKNGPILPSESYPLSEFSCTPFILLRLEPSGILTTVSLSNATNGAHSTVSAGDLLVVGGVLLGGNSLNSVLFGVAVRDCVVVVSVRGVDMELTVALSILSPVMTVSII